MRSRSRSSSNPKTENHNGSEMVRTAGEIGFCALQQLCDGERPCVAPCGIDEVDRWGGLLRRGDVSILFSRGAASRSSLAMQIVANVAMGGGDKERSGALVFTPQRTAEAYLRVMSGILAGVNWWRLSRRLVPKSEIAEYEKSYGSVVERLKSSGLFIEDEWRIGPDCMVRSARAANALKSLGVVMVDQLLDCNCGDNGESRIGWGVIGSRLKRIAKEFDVPIVALSSASTRELTLPAIMDGYGSMVDYVDHVVVMRKVQRSDNGVVSYALDELTHVGDCVESAIVKLDLNTLRLVESKVEAEIAKEI